MKFRPAILYVITSFGQGGAQKNMLELARRAASDGGFEVFAAALKDGGVYETKFRDAGIKTFMLGSADSGFPAALTLPAAFARLVNLADVLSADIIHSFLFQANILSRFAAKMTRARNVSSVRVMEKEKKLALILSRATGFLVDALTVNSAPLLKFASSTEGVSADKITLIPNYLGNAPPPARSSETRRRFGFSDEDFVVAAAGRLSVQKGFEYLIDAVALIKDDIPRLKAVIAGGGKLMGALDKKIKSMGLSSKVTLAGEVADASVIMASADLTVIPSLWEGFPNVALESVAAGVPVLATDSCGLEGFIEKDFLVASADAVALAHKIMEIERSPDAARRSAVAAAGRLPAYSSEKIFESYFDIYEKLIREASS